MNEHQGTAETGSVSTNGNTGEAARLARDTRSKAHEAIGTASSKLHEARHEAGKEAEGVVKQVEAVAEEQKASLSSMLSDIAAAAQSAGEQLSSRQQSGAAGFASSIGQGLSSMAETLKRQRPGDIMSDVQQFARANPTAFIGGAVLIGVALARFAKASSPRSGSASRPAATRTVQSGE